MSLTLKTPAGADLIAVSEMKQHLRVLDDDEDNLIEQYISAAAAHLDGPRGYLGRCLLSQEWVETFDRWSGDIRLSLPDVTAVAVTYLDAAGDVQTVDAAEFDLVALSRVSAVRFRPGFSAPALNADAPSPVTVTYTAGFGALPIDVPAPILQSVRLLVAHFFQNREAVTASGLQSLPLGVQLLCAPWRRNII